jgi:hypothetical protein
LFIPCDLKSASQELRGTISIRTGLSRSLVNGKSRQWIEVWRHERKDGFRPLECCRQGNGVLDRRHSDFTSPIGPYSSFVTIAHDRADRLFRREKGLSDYASDLTGDSGNCIHKWMFFVNNIRAAAIR